MSSRWKRFFYDANLPTQTTAPTIRTTNTGNGGIYDGPVATSPQYLNANLFGKDGAYSNYTSIYGRKFSRASTSDATSRTTVVNDDRFTSDGGVTTAMRTACDEQYLFYELTVSNGGDDQIYPVSNPIKMIKSFPALIDCGWTELEQVGTQLGFDYSIENYYYNSIEPSSSYIRWWRSSSTNPGGTLIKQETITDTTTGTPSSTSRTGTSYYTPTSSDTGYYIVAEIIAVSSYTRHEGYTDNFSLTSFPTDGVIGSALTFSNVAVKDYYGKNGLDNRENWPTGTLNQYTGQLSGWDSNTVLRIRYRVYNYNTGLYWKPSTGTQTTASSAWDSWNSDGSGNGYISNVSVSGGVATFYDYFDLSSDFFNGGGGTPPTWGLEVELSAVRGGPRVYYNDHNIIPATYYISKRIDPTVSVSPSTVGTNSNVTISGTFAGFPATPSTNAYPRQYIIYYGDGNNSGYLPAGEWGYGTLNPTYSNTWSYSNTGTYTVRVRAVPHGEDATATVTVANVPSQISAPTTRATNTFSTSTVKYLDSITWSSGTYSNASSVSSVLLYSTNTSNLISPGGNTNSSFRTTNPYTLSTADPAPPAYIFAVRDTVVGTNGITYYFYSNQITSALADGVSFSYGTATSTSGGWTASINSGSQSGASYSYVSATAGSGSVNSSTGAVTATGLTSNQSSTITVQKSVSGYNNITATASGQSGVVATTPSAPTNLSVDNITFTSARINWNAPTNNGGATITNYEVNRDGGTFFSVGNVLNYTYTLTGGAYTIGVRAVNSAGPGTAAYINVTIPSFTVPTCVAPSLQFQRLSSSSILRWYCDYPTPSGDWSSITGMQFEIRTTAGGGTLLASGTRNFPGFGVYPYSAAGTVWAFRMGTQNGDISYSTSARFGRARVVMVGTNGTTYFGTWSAWI
jgi:hypothetical protein